jgi:ribosome-binding ATPase YchF (GTP1/OBG family)
MQIGIVGKPNVGKSTFFCAATMAEVEIAQYPFTTIEANKGVAYVRGKCPCKEFGVECEPRNSACVGGTRLIPIEMLDVAGLVPDAWQGKGLGNQFLDDLRQADALINVVDVSGSTDIEGNPVDPGSHDPKEDVLFLEGEIDQWMKGIIGKGFDRAARMAHLQNKKIEAFLHERLTGLKVTEVDIQTAMRHVSPPENPLDWDDDVLSRLADAIRKMSKPMMVAMNKADIAADSAIEEVSGLGYLAIPTCAESELALKRAAKADMLEYVSGDGDFSVKESVKLNAGQQKALDYIARNLERFGSTGVQACLERTAFELLDLITVYPVEDETHLTDHDGRVLPDAFLMKRGSTAKDLAYKVHTDLGDNFIRAINARTKRTVGHDYLLQDGDVLKIVSRK